MKRYGSTIYTYLSLSSLVPTTKPNVSLATKPKKKVEINGIVIHNDGDADGHADGDDAVRKREKAGCGSS
jgi:hypothetical protein